MGLTINCLGLNDVEVIEDTSEKCGRVIGQIQVIEEPVEDT